MGKYGNSWGPAGTWGILLILAVLIGAPLFTIFQTAFSPEGLWNPEALIRIWADGNNAATVGHSLWLGFLVTAAASVLAWPAAWVLSRAPRETQRYMDILLLVPFMTPPYIASMGWILFMQKRGLLEQMVPQAAPAGQAFFSLAGLVMVMSLHGFPFLVTILKNAMLEIPRSMEESGALFGAPPGQRFRKILFPLLTPAFAAGAFLVFVRTLSEYGTPATLGQRIGYHVFTTDIHDLALLAPVQFGRASALSVILTVICLGVWYMQKKYTGEGYDFGGRADRMGEKGRSVPWTGRLFLGVLFFFSAVIPWMTVLAVSLMRLQGKGLSAGNFTLAHYSQFFLMGGKAMAAVGNSLILAASSASAAAVLGALLVWHNRNCRGWPGSTAEAGALLPSMVPGIVLSLGMMMFWNDMLPVLPVYNTMWILFIAYTGLFLPIAVQYAKAAFASLSPALFAAGRVFGAHPVSVFFRIALPLTFRGILAGWMMIFIVALRELVAPGLMAPMNTDVVSTFIVNEFEQGDVGLGMCMAVFTMLFTVFLFSGIQYLQCGRKRRSKVPVSPKKNEIQEKK